MTDLAPPIRLDLYLVAEGLMETRARAQEAIKAGRVRIDGALARKPSQAVRSGAAVSIDGPAHPFVSRGGVKLASALEAMAFDPAGKVCLDLGSSTGGFCDVLLRAGARKVYAVDVGHDQLHPAIAGDRRIVNLEKTHAKDLTRGLIPDPVERLVCDVSFISLKKALPFAMALCAPGARLIALIKPQFEVGPERIGKGGLVKPGLANSHGVAQDIADWLGAQPGWRVNGLMESPIAGGDGNKEFLVGAALE